MVLSVSGKILQVKSPKIVYVFQHVGSSDRKGPVKVVGFFFGAWEIPSGGGGVKGNRGPLVTRDKTQLT